MSDLMKLSLFHSHQHLCYAEILTPSEVKARIEVSVLNFLKILNSLTSPAISDLPLLQQNSKNSRVSRGLLTDDSSIFLSHYFYEGIKYLTTHVVALLRCSRHSLGIMASSRGVVVGRLMIQEPNKDVVDCSVCGSSGYAITGDLSLLEKMVIPSDPRYIIIVEKHAIFQRLAEDRIFNQIPSILIAAKGYPDIATRFLLHRLSRAFPHLPILALIDWNPAGLAILGTFKFGSIGMGLEAYKYACNVKWLGVRGNDLQLIPEESFVPLKPRDLQIAKSLMSCDMLQDSYREELAMMVQNGRRAEIEALYCNGYDFLGKYIAKKIVQADYI
ncbi:hypothetical protein MKX01_031500 [Papaver californicum]|nr:hypothetical protein MKX01_031500 [Papaver californicum]